MTYFSTRHVESWAQFLFILFSPPFHRINCIHMIKTRRFPPPPPSLDVFVCIPLKIHLRIFIRLSNGKQNSIHVVLYSTSLSTNCKKWIIQIAQQQFSLQFIWTFLKQVFLNISWESQ